MKELRVLFRVRNNLLMEKREAEGLTCRQAAEQIGMSYSSYCKLEGLKESPLGKNGEFRSIAVRTAEYFGVSTEDLWPAGVLAVKQSAAERRIDAEEAKQLMSPCIEPPLLPDHYAEKTEQAELVQRAMAKLPARAKRVLELRCQGETLRDIGKSIGVQQERVRQIELWAIRRTQAYIEKWERAWTRVPDSYSRSGFRLEEAK